MTEPFRIAVLISGGGTTLKNLLEYQAAGKLDVEISLVISSRPNAAGLQFAVEAGIETLVARKSSNISDDDYSQAVFEPCRQRRVDLVVMAGFLKFVPVPPDFSGRVINIHPSLIPAFCGHGFYGLRVHQAVLDYGVKISGCTVHFVDNQYDHGPIIMQRVVDVAADDTPQSLAARVFQAECEVYPDVIQQIAAGRVSLEGRRVRLQDAF